MVISPVTFVREGTANASNAELFQTMKSSTCSSCGSDNVSNEFCTAPMDHPTWVRDERSTLWDPEIETLNAATRDGSETIA
ncbi:hypothetical protein EIK77_007908 [Talaromyces pinophilus]|nr:hypothetical protein EIK77_007908 [Talaromyces pinophilus]